MTLRQIPDVADRFLFLRNNTFYYRRRIPKEIVAFDNLSRVLCESLGTSNIFEARAKRDMLESGDNEYWTSLLYGREEQSAQKNYKVARGRARALALSYKPAVELVQSPLRELTERLDKVLAHVKEPYGFKTVPVEIVETALGAVEAPPVTLTEVEKIFFDEIAPPEIVHKSPSQKRRWVIDRNDALKFYRHLMSKVTSKDELQHIPLITGISKYAEFAASMVIISNISTIWITPIHLLRWLSGIIIGSHDRPSHLIGLKIQS